MSGKKGAGVRDIVGRKFGRLLVVARNGYSPHGHTAWNCLCDCGKLVNQIAKCALVTGNTKSCGCFNLDRLRLKNHRHGLSSRTKTHPIALVWSSMQSRCTNPKNSHWKYYGGRGIKILWPDLKSFYEDMGAEYERARSGPRTIYIERINNDGNYCKENCKWATAKEQANNTTRNHLLTFGGETKTLTQWAEQFGSTQERIRARLKLGFTPEQALTFKRHQYRV